jgi:hypothetical protein
MHCHRNAKTIKSAALLLGIGHAMRLGMIGLNEIGLGIAAGLCLTLRSCCEFWTWRPVRRADSSPPGPRRADPAGVIRRFNLHNR